MDNKKKYFVNGNSLIQNEFEYRKNLLQSLEQIQVINNKTKVYEELNFIRKTNDSILYSYIWHFTETPKKLEKEINSKRKLIGKPFPLKNVVTINNKKIHLDSLKGKPTLINLWFCNCSPCLEEIPILNEIRDKYIDKCNFIAITYDDKQKVQNIISKKNYRFNHIVENTQLTTKLGFNSYPVNIFLDKNGIIKQIEGGIPYFENDRGELTLSNGNEFITILEKLITE
ncbi:TlpA family protein disulfide reductase [Flavobacterium branchiophilum]|uniref:Thioredoxin domain-containing protein n=1 Tax=Flavobacterium branchiophilum TaxID=55197 RepID=A0A2H3KEL3_9FLAO|nr:TlpA disulfide reductase family protein [Flavobacterium branchiophilum]PDS26801.1 hypothetical protein B0A77_00880 [Flavobacterium branchiophilum]